MAGSCGLAMCGCRGRCDADGMNFRTVKLLIGGYIALSLATLMAVILLRDHPGLVNDAVWNRAGPVAGGSLVMYLFAHRAARGHRRGMRRLRVVSAISLAAIVLIVALPGTIPGWLKVEQGVCGLLLLGVVLIVNRRDVRAAVTQPIGGG